MALLRVISLCLLSLSCFGQAFSPGDLSWLEATTEKPAGGGGGPVYGDVTGVSIDPQGTFAHVFINKGTNGAFSMGMGTNNTGTPNISFTVTSPTFDSTTAASTLTRTVYGTQPMRNAFGFNPTAYDETGSASTCVFRVALSEPVYGADTAITMSIAAGTYNGCAVGSGIIVTNNSILAIPKTLGWTLQADWQLVGSNYNVPVFAYSNVGTNQYHVLYYQCINSDQHGNWHTSSVYTASSITAPTTNSMDANPIPQALIPVSCAGFTNGDYITNYWIAWPTIGTNACVLNTLRGTTGDLWVDVPGRPYAHPWITVCDRLGNYGGYALVNAGGNDSNGRVVLTNTTDWTHPPPAFLTYAAAKAALRSTNAQSYMVAPHDDYCGWIYMGPGNWPYASTSTSVTNQHGYMTVMPTPTNAAQVVFNSSGTFGGNAAMRLCLSNILWTANTGSSLYNYNAFRLINCGFSGLTGTGGAFIELGVVFMEGCNVTNWDQGLTMFGSDYTVFPLIRGCSFYNLFGSSGQRSIQPYCVLGNNFYITNTWSISTSSSYPGTNYPDGFAIGFNRWPTNVATGTMISIAGGAQHLTNGCLVANNITEAIMADSAEGNITLAIKADDATGAITNAHLINNVFVGARLNAFYDWQAAGATGAVASCSSRGNITYHIATKHDTESSAAATRTNAWAYPYGVSVNGNIDMAQTNYTGGANISKSFLPFFAGLNSYMPPFTAAWPGADPPQGLYANDFSIVGFKSYQAWMGRSTNNVGRGDYHISTGTYFSTAFPGSFALPFDIEGVAYTSSSPPGAYATTK